MTAGDGKIKVHPPVESGTSQNEATADKLLRDTNEVKIAALSPSVQSAIDSCKSALPGITRASLLDTSAPEHKAIKTGNSAGDFVVNFGDGAVRNLVNMGDQTLRSIRDPLSTLKDFGTIGKTIVQHPSVVKNMALDFGSSLVGFKGAGEAGSSWGNVAATVGILYLGSRKASQPAETNSVEGADSIEAKVAQTNKVLDSAENSGVKIGTGESGKLETSAVEGRELGQMENRVDGLVTKEGAEVGQLETRVDGLVTKAPAGSGARLESGTVKSVEIRVNETTTEVKLGEVAKVPEVELPESRSIEVKPIKATETGLVKPVSTELPEFGLSEPKPLEVKPVRPVEVELGEVKPVRPVEVELGEVKPVRPVEVELNEVKPVRPAEVELGEVKTVRPAEVELGEVKPSAIEVKPGTGEVRPVEVEPAGVKPGTGEVRPVEVEPAGVKPGTGEVRPVEVEPAGVKPGTEEVRPVEVEPAEVKARPENAEFKTNVKDAEPIGFKEEPAVKSGELNAAEDPSLRKTELVEPGEEPSVKNKTTPRTDEIGSKKIAAEPVAANAEMKTGEEPVLKQPGEEPAPKNNLNNPDEHPLKPDADSVKAREVKPGVKDPVNPVNENIPDANTDPLAKNRPVDDLPFKPVDAADPNARLTTPNTVPDPLKPAADPLRPGVKSASDLNLSLPEPVSPVVDRVRPGEPVGQFVGPVRPEPAPHIADSIMLSKPEPVIKNFVPPTSTSPILKDYVPLNPGPYISDNITLSTTGPILKDFIPPTLPSPIFKDYVPPTSPSPVFKDYVPPLTPGPIFKDLVTPLSPAPIIKDFVVPSISLTRPLDAAPGLPSDAATVLSRNSLPVAPADHAGFKNLTDRLDKISATVPGAIDSQARLDRFVKEPNLENYKNLSDSLRQLNHDVPALHEQADLALAAARKSVVAHAAVDTSQSLEKLLSTAGSRMTGLPPGVQAEAQDVLQQMRTTSQALLSAELSSGQRAAMTQLQANTYDLSQLLSRSKGAQSEVENALLQVTHAQRELVTANYLVRTGDTLTGQAVDLLKNHWVNILGVTAVGLELRSVLGTTAQAMEADLKKLQETKTETPKESELKKNKTEEDNRSSTPFVYSKEPAGKLTETTETRQQAQNLSMYGLDVQWVYYQKGGAAVAAAVEESRATSPIDGRLQVRIFTGDQQEKTSLPNFDYVKTRMPVSRMSAENPYLSTGIASRPGGRNNNSNGGHRSSSSVDPNTAMSLMSKNYAFVVGPNAHSGAASRYGGPPQGSEAAEKHNRDGHAAAGSTVSQSPAITAAVLQNEPSRMPAKQNSFTNHDDDNPSDESPLSTRV